MVLFFVCVLNCICLFLVSLTSICRGTMDKHNLAKFGTFDTFYVLCVLSRIK